MKIFLFRNLYYSGNNVVGVEGIAKQTYFVNNFLCINLNYSGNYNVNIFHKNISKFQVHFHNVIEKEVIAPQSQTPFVI